MSNLIRFKSEALQKSALGKVLEKKTTQIVSSRLQADSIVLLLDVSGSMGEWLSSSGERKIDALRREVSSFIHRYETWVFSNQPERKDLIPNPQGGTNLGRALHSLTNRSVLLVTDGKPDSEQDALDSARNIKRLSCIYIGDPNPQAENFLCRLTEASNGTFDVASLDSSKQLESKVKALLK